jgi:hypothetical protein
MLDNFLQSSPFFFSLNRIFSYQASLCVCNMDGQGRTPAQACPGTVGGGRTELRKLGMEGVERLDSVSWRRGPWWRSWLRSCVEAIVFDEMLQRAACNMNSSFRAFTRHCPCGLYAHKSCAANNEGKTRN